MFKPLKMVNAVHTWHKATITVATTDSVSGQSACRWLSHKPNSRLLLLSTRPKDYLASCRASLLLASIKLYCLVTEAHVRVNNLPKVNMWQQNGWQSNRWPFDYKTKCPTITPSCQMSCTRMEIRMKIIYKVCLYCLQISNSLLPLAKLYVSC